MDEYFKSESYLKYLKENCNQVSGGAHGRVGGGDQIARHLINLAIKPNDQVLEVGCGTGRVLDILAQVSGCIGMGCDVSSSALKFLEDTRPPFRGRTRVLDSHGLAAYATSQFDYVIYWGAFELVPQRAHLLELSRILKPGGFALLGSFKHSNPHPDDTEAWEAIAAYKRKLIPIATGDPIKFEQMLGSLNFEVVERSVFERKAHLVDDKFTVDFGGAKTFSEAIYKVRLVEHPPCAQEFSHFYGE